MALQGSMWESWELTLGRFAVPEQLCSGGPPADAFIAPSLCDVKFPDLDPAKQPTGRRTGKNHKRNQWIGNNELKALCRNLLLRKALINGLGGRQPTERTEKL